MSSSEIGLAVEGGAGWRWRWRTSERAGDRHMAVDESTSCRVAVIVDSGLDSVDRVRSTACRGEG